MSTFLKDWYHTRRWRAEYFDQLARIREEAGDHEGAERARRTAAEHRP